MMRAGSDRPGAAPRPGARRAVSLTASALVRSEPLRVGGLLPLLVTSAVEGVDLVAWAAGNRAFVEDRLVQHGGVLFRGFDVETAAQFEQVVEAVAGPLLEYHERSSPRTPVGEHSYTSTDYPADQSIYLHNESSYAHTWPQIIAFCCLDPAAQGGETPLADCRQVYAAIDPAIRAVFEEKKVLYVRNFGTGFGLGWQTVFQTDNPADVEAYCRRAGLGFEWRQGNRLRTRKVAEAVRRHPRTGQSVWFNHATFFHVSTLEPSIRASLLAELPEEDLPSATYYGDGSPIEPETLDALHTAYRASTVTFPWQRDDVLLLDNMLTAHGRNPYAGRRRVIVAMAQPVSEGAAGAPGLAASRGESR